MEPEKYSSVYDEFTPEHNYRTGSRTPLEEETEVDSEQFSQEQNYEEIDLMVELVEYNFEKNSPAYDRLYNNNKSTFSNFSDNITDAPQITMFKMPERSPIYGYSGGETMLLAYFVIGLLLGTILFLTCFVLQHVICYLAGRKSNCGSNITGVFSFGDNITHRRLSEESIDIAVRTTADRGLLVPAAAKDVLPPSYSTCLLVENEEPPSYSSLLDGTLPYSGQLPDCPKIHQAMRSRHE